MSADARSFKTMVALVISKTRVHDKGDRVPKTEETLAADTSVQ